MLVPNYEYGRKMRMCVEKEKKWHFDDISSFRTKTAVIFALDSTFLARAGQLRQNKVLVQQLRRSPAESGERYMRACE